MEEVRPLDRSWYAIFARTIGIQDVVSSLRRSFGDDAVLYPRRKMQERRLGKFREVIRPFFPGYLFIADLKIEDVPLVIDVPHVLRILGWDAKLSKLRSVTRREMELVHYLTTKGEIVESSFYVKEGEMVHIVSGPLLGREALVVGIEPRKKRIRISLKMFGLDRTIELAGEMVERIA